MLTQCPECQTTFRLHVKQLKAADGKVRCSRCHTTFDALDNLVERPTPSVTPPTVQSERALGEPTVEQTPAYTVTVRPGPTPPPARKEEEQWERYSSPFEQPAPDTSIGYLERDAIDELIDELESSTTPPAAKETLSPTPEAQPDSQEDGMLSAAIDSIDTISRERRDIEEPLPLVEPVEEVEEHHAIEAVWEEPSIEAAGEMGSVEALGGFEAGSEVQPSMSKPALFFEESVPEESETEADTREPGLEAFFEETVSEEPETEADASETGLEAFFEETVQEEPETEADASDPGLEAFFEEAVPEESEAEADTSETGLEAFFEETVLEEAETEADTSETGLEAFFEETVPEESETEADASESGLEAFFEETVLEEAETEANTSESGLEAFFEKTVPEEPEAGADMPEEPEIEEVAGEPQLDLFFEEAKATVPPAPSVPIGSYEEESRRDPVGHINNFFDEELDIIAEQRLAETPMEEPEVPLYDGDFGGLNTLSDQVPDEGVEQEPIELADMAAMDERALPDKEEEPPTKAPVDQLSPTPEAQVESMLSLYESQQAELAEAHPVETVPPDELTLDSEAVQAESHAEPPPQPAASAASYAIPTELTQARQGSTAATLGWGLGILLLCAGLVLQYLYYFRLQLVENTQLRVVISAMCDITGCELPPRRDLGRIEVAEHLMQFHPTYENSLRLTATLTNSADFDQPYPLVEVIMTDIEQRVVARRHFTPDLYLSNYRAGDTFAAHSEVPLLLEVLDPGNSAVGFEFRFY